MTITMQDVRVELMDYEHRTRENAEPTNVGETFLRFMGAEEYYMLMEGRDLINTRDHSRHARTNSQGFCFLRVADDENWCKCGWYGDPVKDAYEFLSGIVDEFVAVEFVNEGTALDEWVGSYADPMSDDWGAFIGIGEYSTTSYNRDKMRPIRAHFMGEWGEVESVVEL